MNWRVAILGTVGSGSGFGAWWASHRETMEADLKIATLALGCAVSAVTLCKLLFGKSKKGGDEK